MGLKIKFDLDTGAYAVAELSGEANDIAILPTGQSKKIDSYVEITEAEYKSEIVNIVNKLCQVIGVNMNIEEAMAKIAELETQVAEANEKYLLLEALSAKVDEVSKQLSEKDAECSALYTEKMELEATIRRIEMEKLGEARFAEIGSECAYAAFNTDSSVVAQASLAKMTEDSYAQMKNMAQIIKKLSSSAVSSEASAVVVETVVDTADAAEAEVEKTLEVVEVPVSNDADADDTNFMNMKSAFVKFFGAASE